VECGEWWGGVSSEMSVASIGRRESGGYRVVAGLVGHPSPSAAAAEEAGGGGDDAHDDVGHSTDDGAHDRDVHGLA
jgi:hypothetical protein